MKNIRLGELLIEEGVLTEAQLNEALRAQKESNGQKLGDILVERKFITEEKLMGALRKRLNVPLIDLQAQPVSIEAVRMVSEALAKKYELIPIKADKDILTVATNNPLDYYAFEELSLVTGLQVTPVLATKQGIRLAIQKYYTQFSVDEAIEDANREFDLDSLQELRSDEYNDMLDRVESAPVVRLVNSVLAQAYRMRASDVHIEPGRENVRVRFRVDGDLIEAMLLNSTIHISLVTRLKILSGIDIAERRIPQDGRFSLELDGKTVNLRVSTLPTVYGEKVVIRILGDSVVNIVKIADLGISKFNLDLLYRVIRNPNGIVLVTGPTGSGKSTTIYSILNELCLPSVNIVTLEDPVEKNISGINQVQVNTKAGLTFSSGLRSILRQDPDIIMVGEIRDGETASIAARAAITGHLVFSTLHTNDAASTFLRIIDMGVEPYIVASSIVGVISQRLVRLVCPHCKEEYEPAELELETWKYTMPAHFYTGKGCVHCNFTGYLGRTSIHEVIAMTPEIGDMVLRHATANEIKDHVRAHGGRTLRDSLAELVFKGKTTMRELLRVTYNLE